MARSLEDTGKHLIRILRQGGKAAAELSQIFVDGRDEILRRVIKRAARTRSQAQLEALIHSEVAKLKKTSAEFLLASGQSAAEAQAVSSMQYLAVLGVTDPQLYKVTKAFVKQVFKVPFPFQNITVNDLLTGQMANLDRHIVNVTRQAVARGETIGTTAKFIQEASGELEDAVLRRKANALARTAIAQTANATRFASFDAEPEVKGVLYTATLDHRTSDVCKSLDGKFWTDKSKARVPPLHVSCRSTLVPVLKGESLAQVKEQLRRPAVEPKSVAALEEKGLKTRTGRVRKPSSSSRSPLKGVQKQSYMTYEQWLKTQPVAYQREILGPKAYNKFKDTGNLTRALGVIE